MVEEEEEEEEDGMPRTERRCIRCRRANAENPFSLEGEVLEGKLDGSLCHSCARDVLDTVRNLPPANEQEKEDEEDEEDEGPPRSRPTCIRCGGPNADNPFSLEGEVLEGKLDGSLCGTCAQIVLATVRNVRPAKGEPE